MMPRITIPTTDPANITTVTMTDPGDIIYDHLESCNFTLEQAARALETTIEFTRLLDPDLSLVFVQIRNDISTHMTPVSEKFLRYRHCHSFISSETEDSE